MGNEGRKEEKGVACEDKREMIGCSMDRSVLAPKRVSVAILLD